MTTEPATDPIQRARAVLQQEAADKQTSEAERSAALWRRFAQFIKQGDAADPNQLASVISELGIADGAAELNRIFVETIPEMRARIARGVEIERAREVQTARSNLKTFVKEAENGTKELRMRIGSLESQQSNAIEAKRRIEELRRRHGPFMAAVDGLDAPEPEPEAKPKSRRSFATSQ